MDLKQAQTHYSPTTYTRLIQLGAGGMGTVHLALARRQPEFQRLVVVKTLTGAGKSSADARAMLVEEARLSARLNHPNVVQVTEVVELDDSIMLVMEYLDGFSLSEAFLEARDAFSLPYRLRAICEALAGLHYAHELTDHNGNSLGIVHRDVSPPNIFLTYDGRVKLLDFGIAKARDSVNETQVGIIKGRLAYMPAEQYAGKKLDRRADVYAMGSILFEAVSNQRLWEGYSRKERLESLVTGVVPRLDPSLNIDPALQTIVETAMQPMRENRYSSAEEMRLAIEAFIETQPAKQQVLARDIGDMLSVACASQREERRKKVEREVQRIEQGRANAPTPLIPPAGHAPHFSVPQSAALPVQTESGVRESLTLRENSTGSDLLQGSASTTTGTTTNTNTRVHNKGVSGWLYAAAAVLLLSSLALVLSVRDSDSPSSSSESNNSLIVHTNPSNATVFLDERRLGSGRVEVSLVSGSQHVLRVTAEGHAPVERSIVSKASSTELDISLKPLDAMLDPQAAGTEGTAEDGKRASGQAPRTSAPVSSSARSPATSNSTTRPKSKVTPVQDKTNTGADSANCNPPFYFVDGIKTYKKECI